MPHNDRIEDDNAQHQNIGTPNDATTDAQPGFTYKKANLAL